MHLFTLVVNLVVQKYTQVKKSAKYPEYNTSYISQVK